MLLLLVSLCNLIHIMGRKYRITSSQLLLYVSYKAIFQLDRLLLPDC